MPIILKQVSSLEKIFKRDTNSLENISFKKVMPGQRLSYQIVFRDDANYWITVSKNSVFGEDFKLFVVKEVYADCPATDDVSNENYIIKEPDFVPDILIPLQEQNNQLSHKGGNSILWVDLDIPKDTKAGKYTLKVDFGLKKFTSHNSKFDEILTAEMEIEVILAVISEQQLIYTRWFYLDCIATAHNVKIFSEQHWFLIEKYVAKAKNLGINMLLLPVHTPPLDTEVGTFRPCVQLVDIEKRGDNYKFDFTKFTRFVDICKANGIKYFEIAHMFSQWGSKSSANIMVTHDGVTDYLFNWDTPAESEEYSEFLKQYIKAISTQLEKEGIAENTYFHVSDEPNTDNIEQYRKTHSIIKSLIGKSKIIDAVSHIEFCDTGLLECPVTIANTIHKFLELNLDNQWVYYCSYPQRIYPNCFIAMPSGRIRILGYLIYKYGIKGFLHWGFNYYNSVNSRYPINPYLTTSADCAFPSGDGFIVYPGNDDAYASVRGEVTYQAIEDIKICESLEKFIGKENVVKIVDSTAKRDLRFDNYPDDNAFCEKLRDILIEKIQENSI